MILAKEIRGAIFDLDGTLLDSLGAWADVDVRFFAKRGLAVPDDYFDSIKTIDLKDAAVLTKAKYGLPDSCEEIVKEWLSMIADEYAHNIGMKEGAADFLRALHREGVKLGIATSCAPELFLPCLARHGVKDLFSAYAVTREAKGKEFPDVYLLAAARLGLPPSECAVFEDILQGIESAKRGGFYTVGVCEPASPEFAAMRQTADEVIAHFRDPKKGGSYIN